MIHVRYNLSSQPPSPLPLMARNKTKRADSKPVDNMNGATSMASQKPSSIPNLVKFTRLGYASGLGLHLWLLAFVSFYMPITSMNAFSGASREQMYTLTGNPALTVAYICGGILILQMVLYFFIAYHSSLTFCNSGGVAGSVIGGL